MSLPVAVQGGGSRNEERARSYIKNIIMGIKPISLALYYGFMMIQQHVTGKTCKSWHMQQGQGYKKLGQVTKVEVCCSR